MLTDPLCDGSAEARADADLANFVYQEDRDAARQQIALWWSRRDFGREWTTSEGAPW